MIHSIDPTIEYRYSPTQKRRETVHAKLARLCRENAELRRRVDFWEGESQRAMLALAERVARLEGKERHHIGLAVVVPVEEV